MDSIRNKFEDAGDAISDFSWKMRCKLNPSKHNALVLSKKPIDLDSPLDSPHENGDQKDAEMPEKNATTSKKLVPSGREADFGSESVVKAMFEGETSNPPYFDWMDHPPKQMSKSAARAQDRAAIKVFQIKDRQKNNIAGRYPLRHHAVEVQNPMLVAALEPIMKKENMLLDVAEPANFTYPFRPLWFGQDEILSLYKGLEDGASLKPYLELLIRVMEGMFSEMRVKKRHLMASKLVDFETAWTLFPRGCPIYSYGMNSEFLSKVESTKYVEVRHKPVLLLETKVLKFNGSDFVWEDEDLTIEKFEGNKAITELEHYPLSFRPDKEAIEKRLSARGKKVLDMQGLVYCCYNGIALSDGSVFEVETKVNVDSRVLIDSVGYNRWHLAKGKREDRDEKKRAIKPPRNPYAPHDDCDYSLYPDAETEAKAGGKAAFSPRLTEEVQTKKKREMLEKEEDLSYIWGTVGGYALKNKLWVQFFVEDFLPMTWNDEAYSHLVYDEQQKDLVLSFVENHSTRYKVPTQTTSSSSRAATADDVIIGKGEGLIILLSGPPGTGKTLTAEAIADRTHRPLFYLQAEDLGIDASKLGANIKRVFEMATDWDAVVLLDEADVFMAERNPNDIHRNELVSIFLRELEYFRGIIFLTTNLYHTIDAAFRSRVNLHLLFQALPRDARETVWRKFLERIPVAIAEASDETTAEAVSTSANKPLDEIDLRKLSLWRLNGREIKNAVKMTQNWCKHKGYEMTLGRLENGIKATSPQASKDGDVDGDLYD